MRYLFTKICEVTSRRVPTLLALGCLVVLTNVATNADDTSDDDSDETAETTLDLGVQLPITNDVGHPTFASPHFNPIILVGDLLYVVNTPDDTLDVIDTETHAVVF